MHIYYGNSHTPGGTPRSAAAACAAPCPRGPSGRAVTFGADVIALYNKFRVFLPVAKPGSWKIVIV